MGKRLMVLLLAFTVVIASCSKDKDDSVVKLGAKIDGKNWEASVRVTSLTNGVFVITGTSATSQVLAVTINGDATGTYELGIGNAKCAATYKESALATDANIYVSASGKVTLTKVDKTNKTISGTFEFIIARSLTDTKTVTAGQFNDLSYTDYSQQ
jgi:hypothetical protein